jgi:AcrR family transcriptional regulator
MADVNRVSPALAEFTERGTRRPGRRPMLSREAIIDSAIEVGFDKITLVEMAQRLGVKHSTLYRYFSTRDELVLAAVDRVVSRVEWPAPVSDWREYLTDTAFAAWRLYSTHPGLAEIVMVLPALPEAVASNYNRIAVDLLDLGFQPVDAVTVVDVVMELTMETFMMGRQLHTEDLPVREQQVGAAAALLDHRLRPIVLGAVTDPPQVWFQRKLSLLFDGVASRVHHAEERGSED